MKASEMVAKIRTARQLVSEVEEKCHRLGTYKAKDLLKEADRALHDALIPLKVAAFDAEFPKE